MLSTDLYLCDSKGKYYIFKDVEALGDCTILAVLCHENFRASISTPHELHWAVVSFAQGPGEAACSRVYSILWATNGVPFHRYLQQVLVPRFWVGTEFFVFVSLLYGVEVKVHFFGADTRPTEQSSRFFLEHNFPNHVTSPQCNTVCLFSSIWQARELLSTILQSLWDATCFPRSPQQWHAIEQSGCTASTAGTPLVEASTEGWQEFPWCVKRQSGKQGQ